MGGYGSGRPGRRDKAEYNRSLDVNLLHREGCLESGRSCQWQWSVDGERVAWIGLEAELSRLILSYRVRVVGEDWQDVRESVPIQFLTCNFGGARPYFLCPGIVNGRHCGRRVVKLYCAGRYFLCRHCYELAYASQSETKLDRLLRTANKRRTRLGGEIGMSSLLPRRPKGMWRRTYEREIDQIINAEDIADRELCAKWAAVLGL